VTARPTIVTEPYEPRPIRFLELWQPVPWRLKVYGIAYRRGQPRAALVDAAKRAAGERLATIPATVNHYLLGYLGIHDGRTANFVFLDYWANENELYHHVYVSPTDEPARLEYVTPTGLTACVWDLRLIAFERQSWLENVLQNPRGPDPEAYLQRHLNEDV
jgi:hypothetical protein